MKFKVYNLRSENKQLIPSYELYEFNINNSSMLLDILFKIKNNYNNLFSFKRSCREGICGSCGINFNGKNMLACLNNIKTLKSSLLEYNYIHPLPHYQIEKYLVVDFSHFYKQHKNIKPWLIRKSNFNYNLLKWFSKKEYLQSKNNRFKIDNLYECILCACCTTSCPSYWWNSFSYLGPAVLLQLYRWIVDSRDMNTLQRILNVNNPFSLYRCQQILNCTNVCPKHLDPASTMNKLMNTVDSYNSN